MLRGVSALDLHKLQCVQNSLARIVANITKYSHITPARKAIHWLLIKYRSIFKTAVLVYKFPQSVTPKYFELVKVSLMACFLRFPTLLQFLSLESILDSVLHMTHLRVRVQTHLPSLGQS